MMWPIIRPRHPQVVADRGQGSIIFAPLKETHILGRFQPMVMLTGPAGRMFARWCGHFSPDQGWPVPTRLTAVIRRSA